MWWLGLVVTGCENGYNYWIQPQLELNEVDVKAWCYPTAAASLLAFHKNFWDSRHTKKYPETYNEYYAGEDPSKRTVAWGSEPWGDYMWHKNNDDMNLGYFMNTTNTGTEFEKGRIGIQNFLNNNKLSSWNAVVEDHEHDTGSNDIAFLKSHGDKLPFLVHINPKCCQLFEHTDDFSTTYNIAASLEGDKTYPYNSQPGHTIVVWEDSGTYWHGASNTNRERTNNTRTCTGFDFTFNSDSCIDRITTVTFNKVSSPTPDESSSSDSSDDALVIGLAAGGGALVLLGAILYKFRRGGPKTNQASLDGAQLLG